MHAPDLVELMAQTFFDQAMASVTDLIDHSSALGGACRYEPWTHTPENDSAVHLVRV